MESVEDIRVTSLLSRVEELRTRLETLLNSQECGADDKENKEHLEKLVKWSEICVSALHGLAAEEVRGDVKSIEEMLRIIEDQSEIVHYGLESECGC